MLVSAIKIGLGIQYALVGFICGLALAWLIRNFLRRRKNKASAGGCAGCALSQTCAKSSVKDSDTQKTIS